jgi:hypothetical protein
MTMQRLRILLTLPLLLLTLSTVHAQMDTRPLVVFVENEQVQAASLFDTGPTGVSRFGEIFQSLGARTQIVDLLTAIPEEARVVVLVGQRRPLPSDSLARIWLHMQKGNHLLFAVDPTGQSGLNTEAPNGGIARLLTYDYGVSLLNGLLVESGATHDTISTVESSYLLTNADPNPNPITAPLLTYHVPVEVWGARHLRVEPFGPDSMAAALLYAEPAYAETEPQVFRAENPAPLEMNIGVDYQGRLTLGGIGENAVTGSRIAVLADSEIFQNGFGLNITPETMMPLHPGDLVIAQRLAAWLLDLPAEQWPVLPSDFTWLLVDGSDADWSASIPAQDDGLMDNAPLPLNMQSVRLLKNDNFLYLLVNTIATPDSDAQLDLGLDDNQDGFLDHLVSINSDGGWIHVMDGTRVTLPDARLIVGDVIEAWLPLRALGLNSQILSLCLTSKREPTETQVLDCTDQPVTPTVVQQRDPAPIRFPASMLVTVTTDDHVNVRSGSSTAFPVIATFRNGEILAALGRTAAGDWIEVQNGRALGWLPTSLVTPNGDVQTLPVL